MCLVSHVTCHISVVKLVGGGSIINGAYAVYLLTNHAISNACLDASLVSVQCTLTLDLHLQLHMQCTLSRYRKVSTENLKKLIQDIIHWTRIITHWTNKIEQLKLNLMLMQDKFWLIVDYKHWILNIEHWNSKLTTYINNKQQKLKIYIDNWILNIKKYGYMEHWKCILLTDKV